eukprot:SAG11_NODE_177_length_13334_cov_9.614280_1_plen_154_part_00
MSRYSSRSKLDLLSDRVLNLRPKLQCSTCSNTRCAVSSDRILRKESSTCISTYSCTHIYRVLGSICTTGVDLFHRYWYTAGTSTGIVFQYRSKYVWPKNTFFSHTCNSEMYLPGYSRYFFIGRFGSLRTQSYCTTGTHAKRERDLAAGGLVEG